MRVLVVTPYFAPAYEYGGPPRVLYEVFRRLASQEHEITVCTTDVLGRTSRYAAEAFLLLATLLSASMSCTILLSSLFCSLYPCL